MVGGKREDVRETKVFSSLKEVCGCEKDRSKKILKLCLRRSAAGSMKNVVVVDDHDEPAADEHSSKRERKEGNGALNVNNLKSIKTLK
jgi:hypothetical protein